MTDGSQAPSAPEASTVPLRPAVAAGLVFLASGSVLVLEILGVRLLAPYVGLTLETTTSIIGVVLGGIAAGSALGGRLADRLDPRRLIAGLLVVGGMLGLATVPVVRALGPGADGDAGALFVTFVALLPGAASLSAVTPAVARLQLRSMGEVGTVYGRLSAWATAGALAGTFGTGFVLVPLLPVSVAVLGVGVGLILAGVLVGLRAGSTTPRTGAAIVAGGLLIGLASVAGGSPCDAESTYHCARVTVDPERAGGRLLLLDDLRHSYVDLDDPRHLEFPYTRWVADGIDGAAPPGTPLDAVFVGGGAFTLPRYLEATRPRSRSLVLEVDGKVVDLARRRFGLRTGDRLRVDVGDARVTLRRAPDASADVVVGDAFGALAVPWHLTTREWLTEVRRVLRPDGLYVLNVIDRGDLGLVRAIAATLLDGFADVRVVRRAGPGDGGGNVVFYASQRPLPAAVASTARGAVTLARPAVQRLAADADVLTDDDAPAEALHTAG